MSESAIRTSIVDHVAEVSIHRPEKRNAMTLAMWHHLAEVMMKLDADAQVRCIVISGGRDGEHFCAGADIGEFATERKDAASARNYEDANIAAFAAIRHCLTPTLAMISGYCIGGGFGIAAACDLRLASHGAQFGVPAAKLGLAYPVDAMGDIIAAIGEQKTKELLFTGKRISADEAFAIGFLADLPSPAELHERADALALAICQNAPLTLRAGKAAILAARTRNMADISAARTLGDATFDSDDYAEGRAGFMEKRKAEFRGK